MNQIERAKKWVEKEYPSKNRKWIETEVDSYGTARNKVKIFVYEGSPAKGVIIASYDYNVLFYVVAINCWGKTRKFN